MGKGCLFSIPILLGGWLLKFFRFFVDVIIKGIVSVLVFFGLYIPFFHLSFGLIVWLANGFNPFDLSINSQLFIFGLVLCLACSVIISVRNLLFMPARSIFKFVNVVKYRKNGQEFVPEKPDIYRSQINPELIVYEYGDHFDLFTEQNGRLCYKRTEPKRRR